MSPIFFQISYTCVYIFYQLLGQVKIWVLSLLVLCIDPLPVFIYGPFLSWLIYSLLLSISQASFYLMYCFQDDHHKSNMTAFFITQFSSSKYHAWFTYISVWTSSNESSNSDVCFRRCSQKYILLFEEIRKYFHLKLVLIYEHTCAGQSVSVVFSEINDCVFILHKWLATSSSYLILLFGPGHESTAHDFRLQFRFASDCAKRSRFTKGKENQPLSGIYSTSVTSYQ